MENNLFADGVATRTQGGLPPFHAHDVEKPVSIAGIAS